MPNPNPSFEQLRSLLKRKKSKKYYAQQLGITIPEVEALLSKLKVGDSPISSREITDQSAVLTARFDQEIHTLEELIEQCKIDTSIWKIDKYVQNYWGNADTPHWQVKAFLSKKTVDNDLQKQKDLLMEEMKKYRPKALPYIVTGRGKKADTLLELSMPDLHIGKLAWLDEAGDNYDIDIAVSRFQDAVSELLSRVNLSKVERIHLPLGNDGIHIDNAENLTTAGTPQDTDGRFPKIITTAKKLFINTIDQLRTIAPIDVSIIRGNHDSTSMFLLGEVLEAWYHLDVRVKVNNDPRFRKFYQYGDCGFMYTHGEKEKHGELGLIFATEMPQLWADTKHRFCKLGHFHKAKKTEYVSMDSYNGFQIEILPSLSGIDEWHYSKGFLTKRQAKAYLYDRKQGELASYTYTV